MLVELTQKDIIYLLKGVTVSYALAELYEKRGYGKMWYSSHSETWKWNEQVLLQLAENTLWSMYQETKQG